ncbi:MAG TPA: polyphosphate kinase 2 family protein [Anaerolineaceae bacterium]
MDNYKVKPGEKIDLSKINPSDKGDWEGKKEKGVEIFLQNRQKIVQLQEILYAEHKRRLLVIIQAMDTAGKDGTIRAVFEGVNPQGVRVASFKVPTPIELDHDYLWRVHSQVPGKGEITIFNRSHYEDVLVVRVHKIVPEAVWQKRFQHIRDFEQMLVDEGTTILKFFLHIDLEEQRERLLERIEDPEKQWKFNPGDIDERKLWNEYMHAYEDVLEKTSTEAAPWYIIPANANWYRNLLVSSIIVNTLENLGMKYPQPVENIQQYRVALKKP